MNRKEKPKQCPKCESIFIEYDIRIQKWHCRMRKCCYTWRQDET